MSVPRPILVALLLASSPACGQARQDDAAIRDLVRRLGDPDAAARDRAEEELRRAGTRAESILIEAKGASDAEVRLRVGRLLREFERRAKRERLRAVPDPPLLVFSPGDPAHQVHRVDLQTGGARKVVAYSSTISNLQFDDLTGRIAYFMQQEGLQILSPGAAESETVSPLPLRSHRGVAWSPAGDVLALVSETEGIPALHLFTPASKESIRLTPTGQAHLEPSWSPDGRQIAFVRNDQMTAKGADLYRMTVAAPQVSERLTTDGASEFTYAVPKRRAGHAPPGSGVPVDTEYHWDILAHQNVRKLDESTYTTAMSGLKYKLAYRRSRT